jgi:hypothetical protein
MSQVLEQTAGQRRRRPRTGWRVAAALSLAAGVAAGEWLLAGDDGSGTQVLGASAGSPSPAPTIVSGPAEGGASGPNVRFTYSHPENGLNFACSRDNAPFTRCAKDGISYSGLAAGPHFFAVAVQQGNGPLSAAASRSWSVGAPPPSPPPPAPVITVAPPATAIDPDATFFFTNTRAGVGFECRLDSSGFSPCTAPKTYADLGLGTHTFFVRATDATGTGPVASHSWTIARGEFGIAGDLEPVHQLAPGVTHPLDVVFTNPYSNGQGINITSLEITVNDLTLLNGRPNPDCIGPQHVTVAKGSAWRINIPRNSTVRLSDRVPNSSDWPQVTMQNRPWNQDACKDTTFTFSYTGTAEK